MTKPTYIHEEYTHELGSPREIVPFLMNVFKPASVADVGCGIGTFLYCFKEQGVKEVMGVDGKWTDKQLLSKYLSPEEFREVDLALDFSLQKEFDLVLCLEVAEHLPATSAETLIKNLVQLGKIIVFSAAVPDQGGQNHINEQWIDYWQKKFNLHNYRIVDMLRPYFWDNPNIHWWYKQNMVVAIHESVALTAFRLPEHPPGKIFNYVHPELLRKKQGEIDRIISGGNPLLTYLKYIYKKIF